MVYTIFVGIICLLIMMYVFELQLSELKYSVSAKKQILEADNYQKCREYLMTSFYTYIDKNDGEIKNKGSEGFFYNTNGVVVDYEKNNVMYDKVKKEFIFEIPYSNLVYRHDYYKLENVNECLKLVFIRTDYINK